MKELGRFFLATVLGVVLDIAIAFALHVLLGVPLWLAAAIGFTIAASVNYIVHQTWSFQTGSRSLSLGRAAQYGLVALATLLVRITVVAILARALASVDHHATPLLILVCGAGASFFVNFLLSKFVVFAEPGSQQEVGARADPSDWNVPAYEVSIYAEPAQRYALVIPVINEGERIRGQLERIAAVAPAIDLIIADGGSTDGSLAPEFLREVGVRAVLTKTGPGKLSAQLRMAYAWCLEEGYDGIVTMDGNGKDGVEAIAAMIAKLDEGCDYVQGSRYLHGGAAINTPLERTIANRFVHAPLLSLGGGHIFTDTTNGFRAYSARYLTHPEVQPFRDEFQVYGLLFYLTVRAGQLGLKVGHVPVTRTYPDSGKVPTKIKGLAPKVELLGETVFAATGGYTPEGAARRHSGWIWPVAVLTAVLVPLLLNVWTNPPYSPDSWALYELSRTVFGDFYRFEHFRSYASTSPFSSAFPPLYPSLIALLDTVFGTGPRTALILAFLSFAGFALASEAVARRLTGAAWIGLAAAIALLLGPSMMLTEMNAGRTIPLQMLFFALMAFALARGRAISLGGAAWIGVLAGLAVMNRFDAIMLPLLVAATIIWLTRRPILALASIAASLVVISPWIAYSLTTFGTLFATDNASIAMSLDPNAFVTDWWPQEQASMSDHPAAWVGKVTENLGQFLLVGAQLSVTAVGLVIVCAIVALFTLQQFMARRAHASPNRYGSISRLAPMIGFVLICLVMMAPQVITGYLEYRYYTASFWAVFMVALSALILRAATAHQAVVLGRIAGIGIVAMVVVLLAVQTIAPLARERQSGSFETAPDVALLQECMAERPEARILVIGDDTFAARAGALAGLHTMMEPRNIAEGRLDDTGVAAFLEAFKVDYILIADPDREDIAQGRIAMEPVAQCPLKLFALANQ
ncbi:MAG: GtrA family protein [Pseudomonadota bacterium]